MLLGLLPIVDGKQIRVMLLTTTQLQPIDGFTTQLLPDIIGPNVNSCLSSLCHLRRTT